VPFLETGAFVITGFAPREAVVVAELQDGGLVSRCNLEA
jgi:hypothetical protein